MANSPESGGIWGYVGLYGVKADAGQDAGFRLYEGSVAKWYIFNNSGASRLHVYNNAGQTAILCRQSHVTVGINAT